MHEMHRWFATALEAQSVPWLLVAGSLEQRIEAAVTAIRSLFPDPSSIE